MMMTNKSDNLSRNKTILLVEDDPLVRGLIRRVLQAQGYTLLEAENSQEALDLFNHYPGLIHLLITDLFMPGMTGKDLARQLNGLLPQLKVLFISGYTHKVVTRYDGLGTNVAFLEKPFGAIALIKKVQEMFEPQFAH
jgi:CheY-like chemotaxis protein